MSQKIESVDLTAENLNNEKFLIVIANILQSLNELLVKDDVKLEDLTKVLTQTIDAKSFYEQVKNSTIDNNVIEANTILKSIETSVSSAIDLIKNDYDEALIVLTDKSTSITQMLSDGSFNGLSAYQVAKENGYQGTVLQWIQSLKSTLDYNDLINKPNISSLDDYEEGTFVPTIYGVASRGTPSTLISVGNYVRVGNVCYVTFRLICSSLLGCEGGMVIGGLPFLVKNGLQYRSALVLAYFNSLSLPVNNKLSGFANPNFDFITLLKESNNSRASSVSATELSDSFEIYANMTYIIK
jgi:hypothetical protein